MRTRFVPLLGAILIVLALGIILAFSMRPEAIAVPTLICPAAVPAGEPAEFAVSEASSTDAVRYAFVWENGATPERVPADGYAAGTIVQKARHAYSELGTRTLAVTAEGAHGGRSAPATCAVNVVKPACDHAGCGPDSAYCAEHLLDRECAPADAAVKGNVVVSAPRVAAGGSVQLTYVCWNAVSARMEYQDWQGMAETKPLASLSGTLTVKPTPTARTTEYTLECADANGTKVWSAANVFVDAASSTLP